MNIEDFRTYCLSLQGVHEKMPFGKAGSAYDRDLLVFSVADKWFCFVNIEVFDFCCIKCDPARIAALRERYEGVKPGYHMNKRHWVSVGFDRDVPEGIILELVRQAYELVVASLSRNQRKALCMGASER